MTASSPEAVGSLMYLTIATRPDITLAVNQASRYLEKRRHTESLKQILKYLKGTISHGLMFKCGQRKELYAYSDADHARDLETKVYKSIP
ncbi:hypothetical protein ACFW04_014068 [Cataglyphis niger]